MRLVIATLETFGLKRGVGADTLSVFFHTPLQSVGESPRPPLFQNRA